MPLHDVLNTRSQTAAVGRTLKVPWMRPTCSLWLCGAFGCVGEGGSSQCYLIFCFATIAIMIYVSTECLKVETVEWELTMGLHIQAAV